MMKSMLVALSALTLVLVVSLFGCGGDDSPPPDCASQCSDKQCGTDECGNTCGTCGDGQACDINGQCVTECIAQCDGRSCGDDGCGGVCGTCSDGQTCDPSGQCVSSDPCEAFYPDPANDWTQGWSCNMGAVPFTCNFVLVAQNGVCFAHCPREFSCTAAEKMTTSQEFTCTAPYGTSITCAR